MINENILNTIYSCKDYYKIQVKLIYFKKNGKYYGKGEYMEDYIPIDQIWDRVREMKELPGLDGKWDGIISIDVPEHIHNHPHLLIMGKGFLIEDN